jgi:hypothetical protein
MAVIMFYITIVQEKTFPGALLPFIVVSLPL